MIARLPGASLKLAVTLLALFLWIPALVQLAGIWNSQEQYSHGWLVPAMALFLAWIRGPFVATVAAKAAPTRVSLWEGLQPRWFASFVFAVAALMLAFGTLSNTSAVLTASVFVLAVAGIGLWLGPGAWRHYAAAIGMLLFMLPLPGTLYDRLSFQLQLVSSALGVAVINGLDISAFRSGNLIDLGAIQLQVAEACDGLRFLFPLMCIGYFLAALAQVGWARRVLIFVVSVPLAIVMNGLRIGVTGYLVDRVGVESAQGFYHFFEGWVVFVVAFAVHLAVVVLLLRGNLALLKTEPEISPRASLRLAVRQPATGTAVAILVISALAAGLTHWEPPARQMPRVALAEYPAVIDERPSTEAFMHPVEREVLQPTDYVIRRYGNAQDPTVEFMAVYWDQQPDDPKSHSPQYCLPGGGWKIRSVESAVLTLAGKDFAPLEVNRLEIERDFEQQLVYYWFIQAGRPVRQDRWMLMARALGAIVDRRTDGALIRLRTPRLPGEDWSQADARVAAFAQHLEMQPYIPGRD